MARLIYTNKLKRLIIFGISLFVIIKLFSKLSSSKKKRSGLRLKPDINLNLYGPKRELHFTPVSKKEKKVFHFGTEVNPLTEIKEYAKYYNFDLTQVERMDPKLKICEQGNKNCNSDVESMCKTYDYLIFSDILYEARPFVKANCRAKIILHLTKPFDNFVPESEKSSFTNLLRKALNADKVIFIVPYRAYLYDACERGLYITKYINVRSSVYPPQIKSTYVSVPKPNPHANETIAIFNRYYQEKLLIEVFKKNNIKHEVLDYAYGGPEILSKYKAVVHIPYTPAPYSLYENICNDVMIFVPTREFLKDLNQKYPNKIEMSTFERYLDLRVDQMSMIYECFDPYTSPYLMYFSNFKVLLNHIAKFDAKAREARSERNREFSIFQKHENLYFWGTALGYGNVDPQTIYTVLDTPYCKMKTEEERKRLRNKQRRIEIAARKKKKPSKKVYANQLS